MPKKLNQDTQGEAAVSCGAIHKLDWALTIIHSAIPKFALSVVPRGIDITILLQEDAVPLTGGDGLDIFEDIDASVAINCSTIPKLAIRVISRRIDPTIVLQENRVIRA